MRGITLAAFLVLICSGHEPVRLLQTADQEAFRLWFTFLAEAQYFRAPEELPAEINDCAALIRYSYREAVGRHDDAWRNGLGLRAVPSYPAVNQKLGANLFQTGPDSFAQFADAKTLRRWNAHFISRDLSSALPGDILFYRQLSQRMPFHTMVWLGASKVDRSTGPWLLYHTGPTVTDPGEVRRVLVEEMTRHPDPKWRPAPGNENFLGVYRWNIL